MQRKNDLDNAISIPVGILSVIGGVIFISLKELKGADYSLVFFILVILLLISAICLVLAGINLIRSYYSYSYRFAPTSSELKKYYDDLVRYYDGNTEKAESEFIEYACGEYAANAHVNSINNDSKSAYMHKGKRYIIGALAGLLIACPFYLVKYYALDETQEVEIVDFDKYLEKIETMINSNKDMKIPAPTPPKPEPPKPEPPKSRTLKENQQPQKTDPPSRDN